MNPASKLRGRLCGFPASRWRNPMPVGRTWSRYHHRRCSAGPTITQHDPIVSVDTQTQLLSRVVYRCLRVPQPGNASGPGTSNVRLFLQADDRGVGLEPLGNDRGAPGARSGRRSRRAALRFCRGPARAKTPDGGERRRVGHLIDAALPDPRDLAVRAVLGGVVKRVCSRSSLPGAGRWPNTTPFSWHSGLPPRATA